MTKPTVPMTVDVADIPDFTDCYIGWDESEPTHVLFDARYVKRATAISCVARDYDIEFRDARCVVAYARWLSRDEIWTNGAKDRWWDDQGYFENGTWVSHNTEHPNGPPAVPVDGWEPSDSDPTFELCSKDAPGATKVWKVKTGL
jgi:hypothetical protein